MIIRRDQLRAFIPSGLLHFYRVVRAMFNRWKYKGNRYYCNVCSSKLKSWTNAGPSEHCNLVCPVCNSYGRHRMMAKVIESEHFNDEILLGSKMLHFAPELGLKSWLKQEFSQLNYQTADLFSPDVDLRLNLENIALTNESVDSAILSHVLEHVHADIQALNELNRILRPGGRLFIQVPLSGKFQTIEKKLDLATDRLEQYGQTDHVRLYGSDLKDRLFEAGFEVAIHEACKKPYADFFTYMALDLPDDSSMIYDTESTTFVCRKI